jgi:signal transduction histidine kinase
VQVMINLVGNAVKYSPPGGLIKISFAEKQNWLEVRIEDEGPGIPDQFKDSIFERFEQVKGSESHRKAGTGLGLAISKAIIEEHGGEIGVESSPGCGSTFWFQLKSAGLSTSLSDRV